MKWASFAKGPFKRRIKKVKELFKEEDKVLFIFENQDLRLDMKMPDSVRTALKEKFDNGYRGYF